MTDEKKLKRDDIAVRVCLVLIILVLLGMAGLWFLRMKTEKMFRLSACWSGDQIHVSSAKDGPWLVTHLVAYQAYGGWRAVAQLTNPVTIIDSRGHYFSREEIDKLEWVDFSGGTQTPPAVGEEIGVMYIVPTVGKRPPKKL